MSQICFTENERLLTNFGYLTAKELYHIGLPLQVAIDKRVDNTKSIEVLTNGDFGFKSVNATKIYKTELKSCVKITIVSGQSFTVSKDSAVWVKKQADFEKVDASFVEVGNKLAISSGTGTFGAASFPEEADLLASLLTKLGMDHKAPDAIWGADQGTVKSFLQSYFSSNGQTVNTVGLVCFGKNIPFLKDINILLSMFGVASIVDLKPNEHNIAIKDRTSLVVFMKEIGLKNALKAKNIFSMVNGLPIQPQCLEAGVISIEPIDMCQVYTTDVLGHNGVTLNGIII